MEKQLKADVNKKRERRNSDAWVPPMSSHYIKPVTASVTLEQAWQVITGSVLTVTLGARGLHAALPDGRPKAGKTSGLYEANEVSEVLVASDLWFQPSFLSQNLTLELSQGCDSWSNQFYLCYT